MDNYERRGLKIQKMGAVLDRLREVIKDLSEAKGKRASLLDEVKVLTGTDCDDDVPTTVRHMVRRIKVLEEERVTTPHRRAELFGDVRTVVGALSDDDVIPVIAGFLQSLHDLEAAVAAGNVRGTVLDRVKGALDDVGYERVTDGNVAKKLATVIGRARKVAAVRAALQ